MEVNKKNIILGFNGDRDSQLTGILLSKQGYNVSGVYYYVNPAKIFDLPDSVVAKFTKDKELVSSKAKEIRIDFISIDVTELFIANVLEFILADKISFIYSNYAQLVTNFLLDLLAEETTEFATGHYLKLLKHNKMFELLMHSDNNLDQSYLFSCVNRKNLKNLLLPLGDLACREREKLVKDYKITSVENLNHDYLDLADFIPESLQSKIDLNGDIFDNNDFELNDSLRSVESTFIKVEDGHKLITSSTYECSSSTLKPDFLPRKLFVRSSGSLELVPITLYFCTMSRFRIEFDKNSTMTLFRGQVVSIYDSSYKNSKLLGSGKIFKPM